MKEGAPRFNNSVKRNSSMRRSGSGITLDGLVLDQKFAASAQGKEAMELVDTISRQGADSTMISCVTVRELSENAVRHRARSRQHSQMRDIGYNCGRIGILTVLYIIFGVIYVDLDTSDEAECSPWSCVFMTSIFTGIICMNSVMPVRVRERAVAFRERSSYMYDAIPFSWLGDDRNSVDRMSSSVVAVIQMYFLVGMIPTAERLFFHILINFMVSFTF